MGGAPAGTRRRDSGLGDAPVDPTMARLYSLSNRLDPTAPSPLDGTPVSAADLAAAAGAPVSDASHVVREAASLNASLVHLPVVEGSGDKPPPGTAAADSAAGASAAPATLTHATHQQLTDKLAKAKAKFAERRLKGAAFTDGLDLDLVLAERALTVAGSRPSVKVKARKKSEGEAEAEEEDEEFEKLFAKAPTFTDPGNAVRDLARRQPGRLLLHGLQMMARYLAPMNAELEPSEHTLLRPIVVQYPTTASQVYRSTVGGPRNERELRTLGEAIDALIKGDLASVGDCLVQRLKAVETAATDQSWDGARHLEVIADQNVSAVTEAERGAMFALRARELKLAKVAQDLKGTRKAPH